MEKKNLHPKWHWALLAFWPGPSRGGDGGYRRPAGGGIVTKTACPQHRASLVGGTSVGGTAGRWAGTGRAAPGETAPLRRRSDLCGPRPLPQAVPSDPTSPLRDQFRLGRVEWLGPPGLCPALGLQAGPLALHALSVPVSGALRSPGPGREVLRHPLIWQPCRVTPWGRKHRDSTRGPQQLSDLGPAHVCPWGTGSPDLSGLLGCGLLRTSSSWAGKGDLAAGGVGSPQAAQEAGRARGGRGRRRPLEGGGRLGKEAGVGFGAPKRQITQPRGRVPKVQTIQPMTAPG